MVSKTQSTRSIDDKSIRSTILVFIIVSFFCAGCGGDSKSNGIPSDSFPTGGSGLGNTDTENDSIQALRSEVGVEKKSPSVTPAPTSTPARETVAPTVQASIAPKTKVDRGKFISNASTPFKIILKNVEKTSGIVSGSDGTIWISYRKGVVEITSGVLSNIKHILTEQRYNSEISGVKSSLEMPRSTALAVDSEKRLWLGFDAGQLLRFSENKWQIISKQRTTIDTVIKAIMPFHDDIYAGSKGLFKWENSLRRLLADPVYRNTRIESFGLSKSGQLYMGARSGLYEFNNDDKQSWTKKWQLPKKDRKIYAILPLDDQRLLLGTANGIVTVSAQGLAVNRDLHGHRVMQIVRGEGTELWARTARAGLAYYDGENWFIAGAKQGINPTLSALLIDKNKRIWLGLHDKGVYVAPASKVRKWIKKFPKADSRAFKPVSFTNACRAAKKTAQGSYRFSQHFHFLV